MLPFRRKKQRPREALLVHNNDNSQYHGDAKRSCTSAGSCRGRLLLLRRSCPPFSPGRRTPRLISFLLLLLLLALLAALLACTADGAKRRKKKKAAIDYRTSGVGAKSEAATSDATVPWQSLSNEELWKAGDDTVAGPLRFRLALDDDDDDDDDDAASASSCKYNYSGILWIRQTDVLGGAATSLLQLVASQLLYAKRYKLYPLIYLDNSSKVVHDPAAHSWRQQQAPSASPSPRRPVGAVRIDSNVTWLRRPPEFRHPRDAVPGPPLFWEGGVQDGGTGAQLVEISNLNEWIAAEAGTDGIWGHYFEHMPSGRDLPPLGCLFGSTQTPTPMPAQSRSKKNRLSSRSSRISLRLVSLPLYLITPGLHGYSSEFSVPAWRYPYLPSYRTKPHLPLGEWLEPGRKRGSSVLSSSSFSMVAAPDGEGEHTRNRNRNHNRDEDDDDPYTIRFRPHLRELARRANPDCSRKWSSSSSRPASSWCLGVHIRGSDKAAGRSIVPTADFLPYVEAFVEAVGEGGHVYVATDSTSVWDEIQAKWPWRIRLKIRSLECVVVVAAPAGQVGAGAATGVLRSSNSTAVFDLGRSHHESNQQALVEVLALSSCQFLVHGLSAISEAAIWINPQLRHRSANLEDNDDADADAGAKWKPSLFGDLVHRAVSLAAEEDHTHSLSGPQPSRNVYREWWEGNLEQRQGVNEHLPRPPLVAAASAPALVGGENAREDPCLESTGSRRYNGILHIRSVRSQSGAAAALFVDVLNQLLYAERHKLLPVIHFDDPFDGAPLLFDVSVHGAASSPDSSVAADFLWNHRRNVMDVPWVRDGGAIVLDSRQQNLSSALLVYPGKPVLRTSEEYGLPSSSNVTQTGSGLWGEYFDPVVGVVDLDRFASCRELPVASLSAAHVSSLAVAAPWALRAWRYDGVPDSLWPSSAGGQQAALAEMRRKGHELVQRYYSFRSYISERADELNPRAEEETMCLAVHIRVGPKPGRHRSVVKAGAYVPYMEAFVRGGGKRIFVATDSHRAWHFLRSSDDVPAGVKSRLRTAGRYVVRSLKSSPHPDSLPTHLLEDSHRVNAEALADILALSRCGLLIHSYSAVAEAAIYLNRDLALYPERTINLEHPPTRRAAPEDFENLARRLLGSDEAALSS